MKILYIADDRAAAAFAARALSGLAPALSLTWARSLASALQWVDANEDAATVVVEASVQAQPCASFVQQVRGRSPGLPVVVIIGHADQAPAALNAGADGYVLGGESLEAELRRTVATLVERERARQEAFAQKVTEIEAARASAEDERVRSRDAEIAAVSARLAELETQHRAALARESRISTALQQRLLELEAALRNADERRSADAVASADHLAKLHSEFTTSLAQAAQWRDTLASKLAQATTALDQAQQDRKADVSAAAEQLARREADLGAQLASAITARSVLERTLADAEAAHRETQQRAAADLAAAGERQAALEDLLAQESDRRAILDQRLAAAVGALQEADRRYAAEQTAGAMRIAELQARLDTAQAAHTAARAAFDQEIAEAAAARQHVERRTAADLAAASERHSALEHALAQESDARQAAEQRLAETESALGDAARRYAEEQAAAAARMAALQVQYDAAQAAHTEARADLEQQLAAAAAARLELESRAAADLHAAAEREGDLAERLRAESDTRAALDRDLAAGREDAARSRRRLLSVVAAHRRRAREQKTRLEAQLAAHRADADRQLRAKQDEILAGQLERDRLEALLRTRDEALQAVRATLEEERQAHESTRAASQSELHRLTTEYAHLRQSLTNLQESFNTLEQVAREHALERARLEGVVSERDSQLSAASARHLAAEQEAQGALAQLHERLRQAVDTSSAEIARLQAAIHGLQRELDASRSEAAGLRPDAAQAPALRRQLEASQNERRRQFERAPFGLCRCTAGGVILEANHSFASLLGRRRGDELRNMDFAAAVFDRAGDLGWVIERARTTRKAEAVEANWKTKDGRRLLVRVQALSTADGAIEIVVDDITPIRALEERLRQGERMEAVGRLAAEVSATCDGLLRDVMRDGQEWVASLGSDNPARRRVEVLLTEITRAASFLRQLGVYAETQANASRPVSVQRVVRDLAPVLKRVVGDAIELVLPGSSGTFEVEMEAERLERVLVTLAGFARDRMPDGGQVSIQLASTIVGRRFVSAHPHVRPGSHVVITITEVPRNIDGAQRAAAREAASEKPGMDLRPLGDIIGQCGGHLWMDAEPGGNMVVKIHVPSRRQIEGGDSRQSDARDVPAGRLARWFRSTSTPVGS